MIRKISSDEAYSLFIYFHVNIYLLGFVLESGSINKGIDELEHGRN